MYSNLPAMLTPLIGRQTETAEVLKLLTNYRLLTLTGSGGCGKTRLALEAGRLVMEQYEDGVCLIDFSSIYGPSVDYHRVSQEVLSTLRITNREGQNIDEALLVFLKQRHMLLIIDNCEHIFSAVARLVHRILSQTNPSLKILATSQVSLGVPGEVEWLVPSLPFPEPGCTLEPVDSLYRFPAVQLFAERAAAVQPGFQITTHNAAAVVNICQRLDGIPLAIELAAARVKFLGVDGVSSRMGDRFVLLSAPYKIAFSRHQTLQAAVDWSYDLLTPAEQCLLNRLAIFSGTWTLAAVEAICSGHGIDSGAVMELLGRLVDHSFVVVLPEGKQGVRYRLLETIRYYGRARLSGDELAELNLRFLEWYMRFAQEADQNIHKPDQALWMDRLEADLPNLHAALDRCAGDPDRESILSSLKLAGALSWFWRIRGHQRYGSETLERLLALSAAESEPHWVATRAYAYYGLGWLYLVQASDMCVSQLEQSRMLWSSLGDEGKRGYALSSSFLARLLVENMHEYQRANQLCDECMQLFQSLEDGWGAAEATFHRGIVADMQREYSLAEEYYRQALAQFYELGDSLYTGLGNIYLGDLLLSQHQVDISVVYFLEAYEHWKKIGFVLGTAIALENLGDAVMQLGELDRAEGYYQQAIPLIEKTGLQWNRAIIESALGTIRLYQHQDQEAKLLFRKAIDLLKGSGEFTTIGKYLLGYAAAAAQEDPFLSARAAGHADLLMKAEEMRAGDIAEVITLRIRAAQRQVGEKAYSQMMREGQTSPLESILSGGGTPVHSEAGSTQSLRLTPRKAEKLKYSGLTIREREIARLIAQGLTNPEIGKQMFISERTVTTHVSNILAKLGFSSRTQIAAWVVEKGITA